MNKLITICTVLLLIINGTAYALDTDTVSSSLNVNTDWIGLDVTYNWTQTWTFDQPLAYVNSATLDIVAFDVSVSQGDIIPVTLDGINLGNLAQGNTNQWNTSSFSLSAAALAELTDESAVISVTVPSGKQIKIKTSALSIDYIPSSEPIAIRDAADAALNAHDLDTMMSYWADDGVYDYVPLPEPFVGKEAVRSFFEALFVGFPEFGTTEGRVLAADNIVVVEHSTTSSTHLGEWMGIPPTGNPASAPHIDIYEFEGDKIKRSTTYLDAISVIVQLGVMPAPELDPALLIPSFPLPDPEPSGLSPLDAGLEFDALYDAHDLVTYAKRIHPDAELLLAPLGIPLNRGAFIAVLELYFLGFPDLNQEILRIIDMGDGWVATEVVYRGTNDGPYFGIPATRRYSEVRGAWIARVDADGLLTNLSVYFDNLTILAQLGLFPPPDPEANKALEHRVFEEIWNQGLLDVADEVFAPDAKLHLGTADVQGPEGFKQYVAGYRAAFPDIHWTVEDQVAEGDIVVTRLTGTGTHQGELMGIPATGLPVTATAIATVRIAGGKIQESWSSWDALGLMQQLGVMPQTATDYTWGAPSEVIGDPGDPMTNTAQVLYLVQKFWNEHNVAALDSTHGVEFVAHIPMIPGHPLPYQIYRHVCLLYLAAFPDFRVTVHDIIAEEDKVAVHWTMSGTHLGTLMGIPPTGRPVEFTGATIHRIADGKIVENWWSYDALGMMQQITAQTIPEGLVVDQITSPSLEGNLLGDPATREVIVYLPPSYNQGGNFPVVYLLHGYTGNARTFASNAYTGLYWPAESDFPEGGIYGLLNDLIGEGELKEMIVVMPDASNTYGGSWYTNSELTGNYEDYIVEDLVGYIDSNYRTIPSRDSRAIVGHSMGGYGAMKLAMKHPDVFGAVASHGGALYLEVLKGLLPAVFEENPAGITGPAPDKPMTSVCYSMSAAFSPNLANSPSFVDLPFEYPSPEIIDVVWDRFMEHDVVTMLGTYGTNVSSLRGIYMDVGAQDEFASNFQTDAFHQALDAAGIGHEYEIYSGTHYDKLFERLTISLKFLSDALGD